MAAVSKITSNFSEKFKNCIDSKLEAEPEWKNIRKSPGIDVWRIRNFKLEKVKDKEIGTFYDGDSYIIFQVYEKSPNSFGYNIFIWIGQSSTSDEYGTAAFKMAELDLDILHDAAVQHREVQNNESKKFLTLFSTVSILKGGYETGYNKVKKGEPTKKLYHISGIRKNVTVKEISYQKDNITNDDVFILDHGDMIYQINGKSCSKEEKFKGAQVINDLKSKRGKCVSEVIDDYEVGSSNSIIDSLPKTNQTDLVKFEKKETIYSLWKVSDETGKLQITMVKEEKCSKSDFHSDDVFIYDTNKIIYVWIGKNTSRSEKMSSMLYAQKYADEHNRAFTPIEKITEGNESANFIALFN